MARKKKKRRRARATARRADKLRLARNPGVSSLMLVNPAPAPRPAPPARLPPRPAPARTVHAELSPKAQKQLALFGQHVRKVAAMKSQAPKKELPVHTPSRPRPRARPRPAPPRPAAPMPEIPRDASRRYQGLVPRKRPYRGKHPNRGVRTLEHARRSILWNLGKGSPGARRWVLDHVPRLNPEGDVMTTGKTVGIGALSFIGARVLANLSGKLPGLNKVGPHAPVVTAALAAGAAWWLGKKHPQIRAPLLIGAAMAGLDQLLRNYIPAYLPSMAGVLGASEPPSAFAPPGYSQPLDLGGYVPAAMPSFAPPRTVPALSCAPEPRREGVPTGDDLEGLGFDVRAAMADDLEGLGFPVNEAMADELEGLGFPVQEAMADDGMEDDLEGMGLEAREAMADDPIGPIRGEVLSDEEGQSGVGAYVPSGQPSTAAMGAYVPSAQAMGAEPTEEGMSNIRDRMRDAATWIFAGPAMWAKRRMWLRHRRERERRHLRAMRRWCLAHGYTPPRRYYRQRTAQAPSTQTPAAASPPTSTPIIQATMTAPAVTPQSIPVTVAPSLTAQLRPSSAFEQAGFSGVPGGIFAPGND